MEWEKEKHKKFAQILQRISGTERNFHYSSGKREKTEFIGRVFDTTKFSDEYCKCGKFTWTMVGITCADRAKHQHCADFDWMNCIG